MKKIQSITIDTIPDYDADMSYLGTFSDEQKGKFAIEHEPGNPRTLKYFNADNVENMKQAKDNYDRMMDFEHGRVQNLSIRAEAEIRTSTDGGKTWLCNTIKSGGLYGIEDDSDPSYFREVEAEQMAELTDALKSLGFSDDEIKNAQTA